MKYALSLSCCLFFACSAFSQVTLGLKIQAGEAWQNFGDQSSVNGIDHRIIHYGASLEVFRELTPTLAIGLAPGYVRGGTAYDPPLFPSVFVLTIASVYTDYVKMPFLLKWQTPLTSRLSVYGQAGAGFSYLIKGYRDTAFFISPTPVTERRELDFEEDDDNFNRFDFGAQAGLGLAFRLGKGQIQLSGEYYNAFLDSSQSFISLNRNWSVGLGYAIRVGK